MNNIKHSFACIVLITVLFPATSSVAVTNTATDAVTSAVSNVSVLFVRDTSCSTFSSAGF